MSLIFFSSFPIILISLSIVGAMEHALITMEHTLLYCQRKVPTHLGQLQEFHKINDTKFTSIIALNVYQYSVLLLCPYCLFFLHEFSSSLSLHCAAMRLNDQISFSHEILFHRNHINLKSFGLLQFIFLSRFSIQFF